MIKHANVLTVRTYIWSTCTGRGVPGRAGQRGSDCYICTAFVRQCFDHDALVSSGGILKLVRECLLRSHSMSTSATEDSCMAYLRVSAVIEYCCGWSWPTVSRGSYLESKAQL